MSRPEMQSFSEYSSPWFKIRNEKAVKGLVLF